MTDMTINLPPDLQQFIAERVANGRYATEDEVVRAALELLARREQDDQERFARLEVIAAKGLASLEAGRTNRRSAEDIKRMARERFLS